MLKKEIRSWVADYKQKQSGHLNDIKSKLSDIDKILDQGGMFDDLLLSRMDLMKQMQDIKTNDVRDQMQKAKIQWAIEGDENSKFFHGIINKKHVHLSIKGIMVDGEWVDDPSRVKDEFRSHFATRFQDPGVRRSRLNFRFPSRLNWDQVTELEKPVTTEEIRKAVWGCGENKSPGPDGFSFEFFRKFWNIIGPDMCVAVEWFFTHNSFTRGCNASFVLLIPKVQDPKSVSDFRPISLIGSLYKVVTKILAMRLSLVIFDLVSDVQTAFLPNRQILDGPFIINELLSWWDPLAPYLFILVMESLHLSVSRAVEAGIFSGIKVDPSLTISHLLYADDAVFIGEWSDGNLRSIMHMLHCFSLSSGLKINLKKSQLLGVGVASDLLTEAVVNIGCSVMKTPFKYLGVMVGGDRLTLLKSVLGSTPIYTMSLYKVPKSVLNEMESLRRNFFNGMQDDERKITWVKWSKVLASKKYGGLGVSSFYALNRALLFKWVWRFISRDNSLWFRFISAMHGSHILTRSPFHFSTWNAIIREINVLKAQGVDLLSHCKLRVGSGTRTMFWRDTWFGDVPFCSLFPRLYALENEKDSTVAVKMQDSIALSFRRSVRGGAETQQLESLQDLIGSKVLSNVQDRWVWDLNGEGNFCVKDARDLLDEVFLPKENVVTRWIKSIPIKINVFAWKLHLDRIPTRINLDRRGVQVPYILCPVCNDAHEDTSHLFFSCVVATDIARLICRWWNLTWIPVGSYSDWLAWFNTIRLGSKIKGILEGVFYVTWWSLWNFRNQLLFANQKPRKDVLFDEVVTRSFSWSLARSKNIFSWESWLQHPYLIALDVCEAVRYFFKFSDLPKGCNSSFIALIPKIPDANLVKDFRPISLIGSIYKIIAKILTNRLVVVLGGIINEVQSAFIKDRQILDGPFILNEVMSWCKKKKKQTLLFKVDFEKAYDSVRWDFLDDVLGKFGFGDKWRKWIQCCLHSSKGSIIINGSPTDEFQFGRGLKQGDPLSPFLFLLIMESLHISFQRVVDAGMFHGIDVGGLVNLSHMFYADDAVFIGEWSESNITSLIHVLDCFHKVSGLKINMCKSKIMGIEVDNGKVSRAATKFGCLVLKAPFLYLGSYVGGDMNKIQSWKDIIDRIRRRLSRWKMKMLSIGGRLMLIKSVLGSMPIFHMSMFKVPAGVIQILESLRSKFFNGHESSGKKASWVQWKKALAPKDNGGLGIFSLYALNRGLIFKWVWRFLAHEPTLWSRVIKAIHGANGKIDEISGKGANSCWINIIKEVRRLEEKGINLLLFMKKKLGNGLSTLFWEDDVWCDGGKLKIKGGLELTQVEELAKVINPVVLTQSPDSWSWTLNNSGGYTVASSRNMIDSRLFRG
ncbi:RNA-directed DNA polymerase, eukaryota [Tanacetum coccineum]